MFPLWYVLIPYLVLVAIVALFVYFNVYHILKFGLEHPLSNFVIAVYVLGFLGVIGVSAIALATFDWTTIVDFPTLFRFQLSPDSLNTL